MAQFVDRRLNPRDKSLGNRQRFLRRTRVEVKRAVDKAVGRALHRRRRQERGGLDPDRRHRRAAVPSFARDGRTRTRVPGNKEFVAGDRIEKPSGGGGGVGSGRQASDSGSSEDPFTFALSQSEFLDILFEDLELPDLP